MANWIDKAVEIISPASALRRMHSRIVLEQVKRSYSGATAGRRSSGWNSQGTSARAEISKSFTALLRNSRELVRNNSYAISAAEKWTGNAIGSGFMAKFEDDKDQAIFNRWVEYCDADEEHDFYGLQDIASNSIYESGNILIRHRFRKPEDGLEVPYQIQLLEIDYLDVKKNQDLGNGNYIYNGIQFDALGRRTHYWLFPSHPGDSFRYSTSMNSKPIPSEFISHAYIKTRPGQILGVPALSSVILRMNDLDEYEDAELMRKKIESCFVVFVSGAGPGRTLSSAAETVENQRRETVEPGMIHYTQQGESVTFGAPKSVGGYDSYIRTQLRAVAAGAKVTYEQMSGDLSQVNFTSLRAGSQEFRRCIETYRWKTFAPKFLRPVKDNFLKAAFLNRKTRTAIGANVSWTPPKWDYVNPLEDVQTAKEMCLAGLDSVSAMIRERGKDPAVVFEEIAKERALWKKLGLNLDIVIKEIENAKSQGTNPAD